MNERKDLAPQGWERIQGPNGINFVKIEEYPEGGIKRTITKNLQRQSDSLEDVNVSGWTRRIYNFVTPIARTRYSVQKNEGRIEIELGMDVVHPNTGLDERIEKGKGKIDVLVLGRHDRCMIGYNHQGRIEEISFTENASSDYLFFYEKELVRPVKDKFQEIMDLYGMKGEAIFKPEVTNIDYPSEREAHREMSQGLLEQDITDRTQYWEKGYAEAVMLFTYHWVDRMLKSLG